jgi:hypothetical protein
VGYHETYEFFAIDRHLTPAEMRALRSISTRATTRVPDGYLMCDIDVEPWSACDASEGGRVRQSMRILLM